MIETDIYNYIFRRIFSQSYKNRSLYLIGYFSKKYFLVECNYESYDKKLIAIVWPFKEWCPELKRSVSSINIVLNYKNFEYFITPKQFSGL